MYLWRMTPGSTLGGIESRDPAAVLLGPGLSWKTEHELKPGKFTVMQPGLLSTSTKFGNLDF